MQRNTTTKPAAGLPVKSGVKAGKMGGKK